MWSDLTNKQKIVFIVSLFVLGGLWSQHAHSSGGKVAPAADCRSATNSRTHRVTISETGFQPSEITANPCDRLTFTNIGKSRRQPAAGPHPSHKSYPELNAPRSLKAEQSYTATLTRSGSYEFHDHYQKNLVGKLLVIEQ